MIPGIVGKYRPVWRAALTSFLTADTEVERIRFREPLLFQLGVRPSGKYPWRRGFIHSFDDEGVMYS
ncbi:hypothetical protein D3C85_1860310 [compost metagenome]